MYLSLGKDDLEALQWVMDRVTNPRQCFALADVGGEKGSDKLTDED